MHCKSSNYFPCAAATFPDAQVSGTLRVAVADDQGSLMPSSGQLLDGYGVRMLDGPTRALKYTQIVLSKSAFEPHFFRTMDYDTVQSGMGPLVLLDVAPDGKLAKVTLISMNGDKPEIPKRGRRQLIRSNYRTRRDAKIR